MNKFKINDPVDLVCDCDSPYPNPFDIDKKLYAKKGDRGIIIDDHSLKNSPMYAVRLYNVTERFLAWGKEIKPCDKKCDSCYIRFWCFTTRLDNLV
jgi:hypothetical protein